MLSIEYSLERLSLFKNNIKSLLAYTLKILVSPGEDTY